MLCSQRKCGPLSSAHLHINVFTAENRDLIKAPRLQSEKLTSWTFYLAGVTPSHGSCGPWEREKRKEGVKTSFWESTHGAVGRLCQPRCPCPDFACIFRLACLVTSRFQCFSRDYNSNTYNKKEIVSLAELYFHLVSIGISNPHLEENYYSELTVLEEIHICPTQHFFPQQFYWGSYQLSCPSLWGKDKNFLPILFIYLSLVWRHDGLVRDFVSSGNKETV